MRGGRFVRRTLNPARLGPEHDKPITEPVVLLNFTDELARRIPVR